MGLLGGDSSSAEGSAGVSLNASGWVVGKGDAKGGSSASGQGFGALPWYGWASLGVIAWAWWKYRGRKRG